MDNYHKEVIGQNIHNNMFYRTSEILSSVFDPRGRNFILRDKVKNFEPYSCRDEYLPKFIPGVFYFYTRGTFHTNSEWGFDLFGIFPKNSISDFASYEYMNEILDHLMRFPKEYSLKQFNSGKIRYLPGINSEFMKYCIECEASY